MRSILHHLFSIIQQVWEAVCSIGEQHYVHDQRQFALLRLVNIHALLGMIIPFGNIFINYLYGGVELVPYNVVSTFFFAGTFLLNYYGYLQQAKYYLMVVAWAYLIQVCLLLGPGAGQVYFVVILGLVPLFITDNKPFILGSFAFSFFAFYGIKYIHAHYSGVVDLSPSLVTAYYYFDLMFFLVVIFGINYYFKDSQQRYASALVQHKEMVEEQNREITDSIRYARQIQQAILPQQSAIQQLLPRSFILYRPKELVSGDFYWIAQHKNKVLFSVIDCTGHGVPGAFMSMIGNTLLNEIVQNQGITQPARILEALRQNIIKVLRQRGEEEEIHDGMDMALCTWNKKQGKINYAGANNDLYVITTAPTVYKQHRAFQNRESNKNAQLFELSADPRPIGYFPLPETSFHQYTFTPQAGDQIFLFSDGYPDQFGGPNDKKLKYKGFRHHLLSCYNEPVDQQEKILDNKLNQWMRGQEQIDDICVMGVQLV